MSHHMRKVVEMAIATALLLPATMAQKPPTPAPQPKPPGSAPTGRPTTPFPTNSDAVQPRDDLVMFLRGRVATRDGTAIPHDVLVERVCNNKVRQQVYASPHGDFSMQLGSRADSFAGASAESNTSYGVSGRKDSSMGIPRHDLMNCDVRASASGFHSGTITLLDPDAFGGSVDVGTIVVQRGTKVEGATVSAIPYKAPKNARKAYEKGLEAEKNGKLADAHKYLETAVEIYPSSANMWFQLGTVLQKQNQKEAAREAYTHATGVDTKFLPPYLSLASMAYEKQNWTEVLGFTAHILDLDPVNEAAVNSYVLDLDPVNYGDAYFYNAMANYKVGKLEAAERSGRKAEHLGLRHRFPQLHLLLAEIYTRKSNYAMAISELQTYLELGVPGNPDPVRERLAKLEKLSSSGSASEKTDPL